MNMKFLGILSLCIGLVSCNNPKENNIQSSIDESVDQSLSESDISKLDYIEYVLDAKTEKAIENWEKYSELQGLIIDIKKGDLSYFNDNKDALKTFFKDFKETIPEIINTPSIFARITALETKLYKLESLSNLSTTTKLELSATIKEFLESVSNFNLQMNKKLEKDSQNIEKP